MRATIDCDTTRGIHGCRGEDQISDPARVRVCKDVRITRALTPSRLGLGAATKEAVHGIDPFLRRTLGAGTLLAIVDIDADLGPCLGHLCFSVAREVMFGGCFLLLARKDAVEESALCAGNGGDIALLVSGQVAACLARRLKRQGR